MLDRGLHALGLVSDGRPRRENAAQTSFNVAEAAPAPLGGDHRRGALTTRSSKSAEAVRPANQLGDVGGSHASPSRAALPASASSAPATAPQIALVEGGGLARSLGLIWRGILCARPRVSPIKPRAHSLAVEKRSRCNGSRYHRASTLSPTVVNMSTRTARFRDLRWEDVRARRRPSAVTWIRAILYLVAPFRYAVGDRYVSHVRAVPQSIAVCRK